MEFFEDLIESEDNKSEISEDNKSEVSEDNKGGDNNESEVSEDNEIDSEIADDLSDLSNENSDIENDDIVTFDGSAPLNNIIGSSWFGRGLINVLKNQEELPQEEFQVSYEPYIEKTGNTPETSILNLPILAEINFE